MIGYILGCRSLIYTLIYALIHALIIYALIIYALKPSLSIDVYIKTQSHFYPTVYACQIRYASNAFYSNETTWLVHFLNGEKKTFVD